MSAYNGVGSELLYSYGGASTNLATFTTEDNLQKTYPPVIIPSGFFKKVGADSSALKIRAFGQVGSVSATTPTFQFLLRLLTTSTWSAGGILLSQTAALVSGSGVTLAPFQIDIDVILRTLGIGAASTAVVAGTVSSQTGFPAQGIFPAAGSSPASPATIDNSVQYFLFLSAICGTSNAANLVNLQGLKVYGEN